MLKHCQQVHLGYHFGAIILLLFLHTVHGCLKDPSGVMCMPFIHIFDSSKSHRANIVEVGLTRQTSTFEHTATNKNNLLTAKKKKKEK